MTAKDLRIDQEKLRGFCAQNQMESLEFYTLSKWGTLLYRVLCYFPIPFLLPIVDRWLDFAIEHSLRFYPAKNMRRATHLRIVNFGQVTSFEEFQVARLELEAGVKDEFYTFLFNTVRFVYDPRENCFVNLQEKFQMQPPQEICSKFRFGRYLNEISALQEAFGRNEMFVEPPKILEIVFNESFSMMGLIETMILVFLTMDGLWISLTVTSFLVVRGRYLSVKGAFDSYNSNIQQVLKKTETLVIRRNDEEEYQKMSVNSDMLVPGDIIEITKGQNLTVDALLVNGSCIFNEEGITGVSSNQIKYPYSPEETNLTAKEITQRSLLLAGSTCIYLRSEINEGCLAIVVGTGYNTFKGKLLRELLMPKKVEFQSFNQAKSLVWFLSTLFLIGSTAFIIHAKTFKGSIELGLYDIVDVCFGIFTSTVKPCLPYCLFMGIQSSEARLKSLDVETTNNYKINLAARCKTIIFDKTGTLTTNNNKVASVFAVKSPLDGQHQLGTPRKDSGMSLASSRPGLGNSLDDLKLLLSMGNRNRGSLGNLKQERGPQFYKGLPKISELIDDGPEFNPLIFNFNFNNSILKVGNGLIGDELDLELYKQCPYEVHFEFDPKIKSMAKSYNLRPEFVGRNRYPASFTVLRTFDYDHNLKRSSVIVRSSDGDIYLLTKGAPEEVQQTSKDQSLPSDYTSKLFYLTSLGYRLIGFAFAKLKEQDVAADRPQLEEDLTFLGLISNESFIRAGALSTLRNLCDAQYKLVMATGDNLYTGISVALQTGLIHSDMVIYTLHELVAKDGKSVELQWVNYQKLTTSNGDLVPFRQSQLTETEYDTPDMTPSLDALMHSKQKIVLAMTADGYEELKKSMEEMEKPQRTNLMAFIQTRGLIYARCRPVQKRRLIEDFQKTEKARGAIVMFVGDEANDAEAIDVADISFLMKRSHLSFRASFTSRNSDFSAVEALVREGKCSMESGFLTFKFFLFMTSLQLVAMFFLLRYFIGLNTAQNIVLDVIISLFFSDYINSFQASPKLTYSLPELTMFNFQFMCNLALHSLAGIFTIVVGYMQLTRMSFYRTPFEIIPWSDQKDNNMSLDTHRVYEGIFFFNSIVLLQLFFFLFTNLKSRYRVSLLAQRDSLYYTIFCVTLFFHLASLSEIDEPSWTDQVLINWFNIGKTFGLLWLYVKMLLMYSCLAYLIEVGLEISFAYQARLHFAREKRLFIQCREPVDAPKRLSQSAN